MKGRGGGGGDERTRWRDLSAFSHPPHSQNRQMENSSAETWSAADVEKWAELRFPFGAQATAAFRSARDRDGVEVTGGVLLHMDEAAVRTLGLSPMQTASLCAGILELKRSYLAGAAPRPELQRTITAAHHIKEVRLRVCV